MVNRKMAKNYITMVMIAAGPALLLVSCLVSLANASYCPPHQYLNIHLQECRNCTNCPKGNVVLRPCEIHRDTVCCSFQEFLKTVEKTPHKHRHKSLHKIRTGRGDKTDMEETAPVGVDAPFTSTETLVWDWQAIALTSAVFACILFFVVITLYSLHQAKQWKRLKETFEADVEELSAKLSLMAAASSCEKEAVLDPDFRSHPGNEASYNNRCVYLEQLLNGRKCEKNGTKSKGNVYIEESI